MTVDEKKKVETVPADSGATGTTQKVTNGYQSQWQSQIDDIFGKIQNREPFKYDVNADALYEQYKDQYINQGKLAMEDTIGQAATLTGGYDKSGNQPIQHRGSMLRRWNCIPVKSGWKRMVSRNQPRVLGEGGGVSRVYYLHFEKSNYQAHG